MKSCRSNALMQWWAAGLVALGLASAAKAEPVVFRSSVVTDIKLGAQNYHNAALKLTFVGDSADIGPVTDSNGNLIPSSCNNGASIPQPFFFWLTKGSAAFSFEIDGKRTSGKFLPGQVFVSVDTCNGGMGFGSFTGPTGLEPIYPLAMTHGSVDFFSGPDALSTARNMSGNAWSCIGFAIDGSQFLCTPPDAYPLHTSAGDLFVYSPYQLFCGDGSGKICLQKSGSMNRGTFSVVPGMSD
jgi:hypothetical protein